MVALENIPGIGKRTVAMMIVATDGFRKGADCKIRIAL
jgi:hypothetical protein